MGKTYIKVSGTWTAIKKIYVKVSGVWKEAKKVFSKVSGVWKEVHSGAVEYTFTSSITSTTTTGIPLSSYADPASGDEFVFTINDGVTLQGKTGNAGANGGNGSNVYIANCHGTGFGLGYNGGAGGAGYPALDFTGFSGKKVTIINNGTIKGGAGGTGGNGGNGYYYVELGANTFSYPQGGCGGAGGAGGTPLYATSGVELTINGNQPQNGTTGSAGTHGANGTYGTYQNDSCFVGGQKVAMADGSYKNIEDVRCGDKVKDGYGGVNTVLFLSRPIQGDRDIFDVDGLLMTNEHDILNGNRDGFVYISLRVHRNERETYETVWDNDFNPYTHWFQGLDESVTKCEVIKCGMEVASEFGTRTIRYINPTDLYGQQLYSLICDGSHTFILNDTVVGGCVNDVDFDYTLGKKRETPRFNINKPLIEGIIKLGYDK
jgi:hypothetical protein